MTNYLTKQGLIDLQSELKEILEVKLPEILESINKARAEGDARENSGLDAAKIERDKLVNRQQEIEDVLSNYEIIDEEDILQSSSVRIGSSVKVQYLADNSVDDIKIVGISEADVLSSKISNESPLAQAIINKKPGDVCAFKTLKNKIEVKILEIL
ncbi:MAG: transcription elongation factor GreA [Patescibacteria group bacterium]